MKKLFCRIVFSTLLAFVLAGCNQEDVSKVEGSSAEMEENKKQEETSETEVNTEEVIEVEPLPSTYEELAAKEMGEHHDFYFLLNTEEISEMFEIFTVLPDISDNPTEKELDYFYQELLGMVQEDFQGPEEAIRNLRFQAIGDPEIEDSRYQFKENLNVEIILDASGSMAASIDGQVKMDAAKKAILKFVKELPEEANVGFRVFGHKGTSAFEDKEPSCISSELVIPISNYNEAQFQAALDSVQPSGWTPTELALREAQKDLEAFDGSRNTNIVYLVGDGISTCDDDPIRAAEELFHSNISPIINVIGFDVDDDGQKQLQEIANVAKGLYTDVSNGNELSKELDKLAELAKTWEKWKKQGEQSLEYKKVSNNLDIFVYITQEESKATDEGSRIYLILSQFWQKGLMDKESFQYLQKKNKEYHQWIREEISLFNKELKALNESNYAEALKILEEKYEKNTQEREH